MHAKRRGEGVACDNKNQTQKRRSITSIPASRTYLRKKWSLLFLLAPVLIYAVLTTVNDLFGIDFTGGWMGDRDPVAAGYLVLAFSPFYVLSLAKGIREICISPPDYLVLATDGLSIEQGNKANMLWLSVQDFQIRRDNESASLIITRTDDKKWIIPIRDLAADISEIKASLSEYARFRS